MKVLKLKTFHFGNAKQKCNPDFLLISLCVKSVNNRPVPTDSNSRAYLGRDSDRDPNKRDYFYFYVWGQKSRDY